MIAVVVMSIAAVAGWLAAMLRLIWNGDAIAFVFFALGLAGGVSVATLWEIRGGDGLPATKWAIRRAQRRNRAILNKTRRQ